MHTYMLLPSNNRSTPSHHSIVQYDYVVDACGRMSPAFTRVDHIQFSPQRSEISEASMQHSQEIYEINNKIAE